MQALPVISGGELNCAAETAMEQITKPVVWAEKFALICMLCVAGGFVFWQWVGEWVDWIRRPPQISGFSIKYQLAPFYL